MSESAATPFSILLGRFPQPGVPFIDQSTGNVSRAWLYYLLSLYYRTGEANGISSATLQQQIAGLMVEVAMDAAPVARSVSPLLAEAMAGAPTPRGVPALLPEALGGMASARSFPALLTYAFDGASVPQQINPFLAGMLVQ
jgi:hypothetical protein